MIRYLLAALVALAPAAAFAAADAVLTVKVENVSPKGGDLRLVIYDERSYADDKIAPVKEKIVSATAGETLVTFEAVAPGTYAIKMFQDQNRNGEFDRNWLGLPKERYGFSNDAGPDWLHLAPPSFAATKFVLRSGENTIAIKLH